MSRFKCMAAPMVGLTVAVLTLSGARAQVTDPKTTRITVASDGSQVKRSSGIPVISGDGRFVAFSSRANRLVAGDTNGTTDVFVWDRLTGTTEIVSINSMGGLSNGISSPTSVSPDGRYVVFNSDASNLVENDDVPPNLEDALDVFVHDRQTHETEKISFNSQGDPATGPSFSGDVSADGRYVAFVSGAANLDPNDANGTFDIFVRDRELQTTELVSLSSTGEQSRFLSMAPSISGDGNLVAFDSNDELVPEDTNRAADTFVRDRANETTVMVSGRTDGTVGRRGGVDPEMTSNGRFALFTSESKLVPGDRNRSPDAYLHNLVTGRTTLVSRNVRGGIGNGPSLANDISADGRYVLFISLATNIVQNDTNGEFDHFLYDRMNRTATRVNLSNRERQASGDKGFNLLASISDDGSFVVFESSASNLVRNDTNNVYDVFLRGPLVASPAHQPSP